MSMRYPGGLIATSPVNARYPSGVWTQAQAAPYQAQNVWTRDQFWPYTTLLLQGDGAVNGAQNNTFLDSSSNNFTITRNGNTTQGSFTPYEQDGYWSNYFNGSGTYLTATKNAAYEIGSGDFTVEAWIYPTAGGALYNSGILSYGANSSLNGWLLGITGSNVGGTLNRVMFEYNYDGTLYLSTSPVALNAWNHVAVSRSGSNIYVFLNGVLQSTTSTSKTANTNAGDVSVIGSESYSPSDSNRIYTGYISNLRFVKGTAVYTSNFTPSAAPLTAITNTSLLTCQSNRFRDNSTNAFAITANGSPSVQAFQPFPGATTWSASVLGGSGYFDGSGDYLTVPQNAAFAFGTGDFTVEFWVNVSTYRTSPGGFYDCFLALGNFADSPYFRITPSGTAEVGLVANSLSGTTVFQRNTWYHYAVSRSGTTARLFINGVLESTVTNSSNLANGTAVYIGTSQWNVANETMTGLLSNLRIVKGTAIYTANFTPPTTPVTAVANTSFLANFANAGIYDNSMMNNLETVGNAQVSTSVVKYGTGSMAFDGSGDYLVPSSPATNLSLVLGSGDFTIEMWVYFNGGLGSDIVLYDSRPLSTNGVYPTIYVNSSSQLAYVVSSSDRIVATTAFVTGQWYHIAICRSGTSTRMFINGTQTGSTYSDSNNYLNPARRPVIAINGFNETAAPLNGYIDDLRVTRAARYITTFTPPPARLPAQ